MRVTDLAKARSKRNEIYQLVGFSIVVGDEAASLQICMDILSADVVVQDGSGISDS